MKVDDTFDVFCCYVLTRERLAPVDSSYDMSLSVSSTRFFRDSSPLYPAGSHRENLELKKSCAEEAKASYTVLYLFSPCTNKTHY